MMRILGMSALLFLLAGCHPGEGERCNPMLFTDECENGFACTVPQGCAVAYCCPTTGTSNNLNCQPCSTADGGTSD